MTKYRRRGGQPRVRQFANLFSYECKVSFYTCFSNAWIDLIPWLAGSRVWTRQPALPAGVALPEPARRVTAGRTAGGLVYPTLAGVRALPAIPGGPRPPGLVWRVPPPGPAAVPDVFAGQVLSLHPLSAYVMRDPLLRVLVGRFLIAPEFDPVIAARRADDSAAYWGLVEAVLMAAVLYRRQRQETADRRGVRNCAGDDPGPHRRRRDPLRG